MKFSRSESRLSTLAFVLLANAPGAQEPDPPVVSLSEMVLEQYPVQNVDSEELFRLASALVGRRHVVTENGDFAAGMQRLGRTIVLYDTEERVKRARELLARLDSPRVDSTPDKVVEYRPRFVSLNTAFAAVENLVQISLVKERGLLILHDEAGDVEQALALLQRVDVPEKQVLLICQLLEVGEAAKGPALPKELADNLQKILPQSSFTQVGMAMLKTSVGAQEPLSLQIESTGKRYRFSLEPVAFDEGTGALTASSCSLLEMVDDGSPRELFRTNTVLRGGEYTVLAATGATPRFLVVRVVPQG